MTVDMRDFGYVEDCDGCGRGAPAVYHYISPVDGVRKHLVMTETDDAIE